MNVTIFKWLLFIFIINWSSIESFSVLFTLHVFHFIFCGLFDFFNLNKHTPMSKTKHKTFLHVYHNFHSVFSSTFITKYGHLWWIYSMHINKWWFEWKWYAKWATNPYQTIIIIHVASHDISASIHDIKTHWILHQLNASY